jgi:hypothetical protein
LDNVPNTPEHKAWNMRPREKQREIVPAVRFNSHFQAERLVDLMQERTFSMFDTNSVRGAKRSEMVAQKLQKYNKTG